ncbi:MAG: hypothetical protein ACI9SP_004208 [Arenicella sp.]|jgi:hypothetical protein
MYGLNNYIVWLFLEYNRFMLENAHIFNPLNNSLAERVKAYRSVYKAWLNVEASLKQADDPEWSNTLGESQELEEAHNIIMESMVMATNALSIEEVDQATDQGLMSKDEASEFVQERFDQQASLRASKRVDKSFKLKG